PSLLVLEAAVAAEVVGALRPGGEVPVETGGGSGRVTGRIARIDGRADARTRRFGVEVEVAAGRSSLRPGMYAVARFEVPGPGPSLYLPKEAVGTVFGERGVFVVHEGLAAWTPVTVEEVRSDPSIWRVTGGALQPGGRVVVAGFSGLRPGSPVEVEP
ncbi:MAG: efflux RND transporter periplasmic adaptor subunit, partial [Planctomycetota bacterium]